MVGARKEEELAVGARGHEIPKNWFTWDKAVKGEKGPPGEPTEVKAERIKIYVDGADDTNRLYVDEAFAKKYGFKKVAAPIAMICAVVRNTARFGIPQAHGLVHPVRPTPFARFHCKTYAPLNVGDVIRSESSLGDKYERRGRHYLTWHADGFNTKGEKVAEYDYTNLWDEGKEEDRVR